MVGVNRNIQDSGPIFVILMTMISLNKVSILSWVPSWSLYKIHYEQNKRFILFEVISTII